MYVIYSTSKQGEIPVPLGPLGRGQVVFFSYCSSNLGDGGQGMGPPTCHMGDDHSEITAIARGSVTRVTHSHFCYKKHQKPRRKPS